MFFCFKQKTAYEMRISDWSSDVCSSDLVAGVVASKRVIDLLSSLRAAVLAIGDKFIAADMCGDDVKVITGIFSRNNHGRGYSFRGLDDADRTGAGVVAEEVAMRLMIEPRGATGSGRRCGRRGHRSEEHTSELQSLMRISY